MPLELEPILEAEAKKRTCHAASEKSTIKGWCVASKCMAWAFEKFHYPSRVTIDLLPDEDLTDEEFEALMLKYSDAKNEPPLPKEHENISRKTLSYFPSEKSTFGDWYCPSWEETDVAYQARCDKLKARRKGNCILLAAAQASATAR